MKGLFRNKEVAVSFVILSAVSLIFTAAAFAWNVKFGIFTAVMCLIFVGISLFSVSKRYRRISQLSGRIDRILHGEEYISQETNAEGELAILETEIHKMVVRMREQQNRLKDEKVYLADSLADISHQIRTPLTSINLIVSMLSEEGISEEKKRELLLKLKKLLSRIDWLITTLLKMSKLDAGTIKFASETIPMKDFINKACMPLFVPIELHGQELSITAEGEFTGDIKWSGEAVGNIIKNCMEHTPEGGRITVRAEENAIFTEIIISDSGSGISEADLPHIFERFYKGTSDEDKGGFGIGLALARMIVREQNGTLKAENGENGGARFIMRFYKCTV